MAHSLGFGREVGAVVGALSDHNGDTVRHVDAVVEQLLPLVGVVQRPPDLVAQLGGTVPEGKSAAE